MKPLLPRIAGWLVGIYVLVLQRTCRLRFHNDCREALASQGVRYVCGSLHAHQISCMLGAERGTAAIVSRSDDGEMVVPMLRMAGHVPIRGSSGTGRKGGATALQSLIKHVLGGGGAMLAVDGPRGPRGSVQRGIGMLAQKTDAVVLMAVGVPTRRWVIRKTWDQFQIPKPFCVINLYMSEPLATKPGEPVEIFTKRIEMALRDLEVKHDPIEVMRRAEPVAGDSIRAAA
jgi:lysophospholipid acyltransferase (LPLAT)-like uncharacterized protein